MKKKLLVATALVSCTAMLFAACGDKSTFNAGMYYESEPAHVYTEATELTELQGYNIQMSSSSDTFIQLTKSDSEANTTKIFDIDQGKVVKTITDSDAMVNYVVELADDFYAIQKSTYIGDGNGTALNSINLEIYNGASDTAIFTREFKDGTDYELSEANFDWDDMDYDGTTDIVMIGGECFQNDNGNLVYAFDFADKVAAMTVLNNGAYVGGMFTYKDGSSILTFDKNFNIINEYRIPDYANVITYEILENGSYVVQYNYVVDAYSNEYDYISSSVKYNLETKLVNPATSEVKDLDWNVLLNSGVDFNSKKEYEEYGYKNVGYANILSDVNTIIDNKRIITVRDRMYGMKDDGALEEIASIIDNQDMSSEVYKINGYYYVTDIAGQGYLLDGNGNVAKQVNGQLCDGYNDNYNDNYIVYNGDLYDSALNEVEIPDGYEYYAMLKEKVLLQKEVENDIEIYTWTKGSTPELFAKITDDLSQNFVSSNVFGYPGYVTIVQEDANVTTYTYYNAKGESVIGVNYALSIIATNREGNARLLRGEKVVDGETVYCYYLAK